MVDAGTRRKFEALVAAAFVDGYLADSEKEVLGKKAAALGIPAREMNDILFLGQQRKLSVALPALTAEREALLEEMIEIVSADGSVEAPEYHLLARFAETLKIPLPELRSRVNRRMQGKSEPRRETVRSAAPARPAAAAPPAPTPRRAEAPLFPPPPPPPKSEPSKFAQDALPLFAPGPIQSASSFPKDPQIADVPPVTLQLLKQSIMFDNEADSIANIMRTLTVSAVEAAKVRAKILDTFPDLKAGSQNFRIPRR